MDVSENRGFSQKIIHFNRVFHYKPSILGYPYFWKQSCVFFVFFFEGIIMSWWGLGFGPSVRKNLEFHQSGDGGGRDPSNPLYIQTASLSWHFLE